AEQRNGLSDGRDGLGDLKKGRPHEVKMTEGQIGILLEYVFHDADVCFTGRMCRKAEQKSMVGRNRVLGEYRGLSEKLALEQIETDPRAEIERFSCVH